MGRRPSSDLRRVGAVLLGLDLLLVAAYLGAVFSNRPLPSFVALLNLDGEGTVAVWYTSAKLLLAGVLFLGAATWATPRFAGRRFLAAVGIALLVLSLDETVGVHELLTVELRRFESLPRFEGQHGLWIPFALVAVVAFLAATARSWSALWSRARPGTLLMGLGLALGLVGAVGLEIIGYEIVRPSGSSVLYVIEVAAEEGLELLGASMLLLGSVRLLDDVIGGPTSEAT